MALFPVIGGLIAWGIIMGSLIVLTILLRLMKYVDKDNAGIAVVFIITSGISTYLLWVVAWMQQWHPLLTPVLPAKE